MTDPSFEQVDAISETVLACLRDGHDDIQQITAATDLPNHKVNYRFTKLSRLGLIEVTNPGGRTQRVIDGQPRDFQTPKQARLTAIGTQYLDEGGVQHAHESETMSQDELTSKVHELEAEIDRLHQAFDHFRTQIQRHLQNEE